MKLAFSTRNVDRPTFKALCRFAGEYGMNGFEIWDALSERKAHSDSVLRSEKMSEGRSMLRNNDVEVCALTCPDAAESEKTTSMALVQYVDMEGMTLEQYQAELEEAGDVTEIEAGTVNGIPCLSYEYNGNGVLAFTTEMGYILEVAFGPLSNEEYKTKASFALASIQSVD